MFKFAEVEGEAGWMDVVPWAATYFTENFQSDPPSNPFKGNIVAIMAVRDVKMKCEEMDMRLRSYDIEQAGDIKKCFCTNVVWLCSIGGMLQDHWA